MDRWPGEFVYEFWTTHFLGFSTGRREVIFFFCKKVNGVRPKNAEHAGKVKKCKTNKKNKYGKVKRIKKLKTENYPWDHSHYNKRQIESAIGPNESSGRPNATPVVTKTRLGL